MSLKFSRIQFTPDLMPMDITGTDILQDGDDGRREFQFVHGPVFANIVLADEINRAPPKTQAAMLEAMQEQNVTVVGKTFQLEPPFLVLATQNPVEQEGTYPLPEAQLDRFMFLIELDYPSEAEEIQIARTTTGDALPSLDHLLTPEDVIRHQHLVRRVPVPDHIYTYAARLVRKTRPDGPTAPAWLKPLVSWGAGPRAVQYLILGAKARAALLGSYMVRLEDVQEVAAPVLTHRVITTFAAQAEGIDAKTIVRRLVEETDDRVADPIRRSGRGPRRRVARRRRRARHRPRPSKEPPPMFPDRQPRSFLDPGRPVAAGGLPAVRAAADAGERLGPAPEPAPGVERRVRRVPQVRPRRRPPAARLAGLRPVGPVLRQGVRGRHEPPVLPGARHQRVDGLRLGGRHQDRVRPADRRRPRPPGAPAGGRRRPVVRRRRGSSGTSRPAGTRRT